MTAAEVEAHAKHLWGTGGNRDALPAWEQLGEVTQSVWLERAEREMLEAQFGDLA